MARKEKYKLSRTTIFQVGDITHTKVNDLGVFESCGAALGEAELNYCAYTGSEDGIELFDHAKWNVMNPARLRRVGACRKLSLPDEPDKA